MPQRIQLQRKKGWKMPPNTMKVARPCRWGNPFRVDRYGRKESLRLYRIYLQEQLEDQRLDLDELRGKDVACWCRLDQACHGDILLEWANAEGPHPSPLPQGESKPHGEII